MAFIKKNLMDLALRQELKGAKINIKGIIKEIKNFIDYDSMSATFRLEFKDGDILELSDKIKFDVEIKGQIKIDKPNKNR